MKILRTVASFGFLPLAVSAFADGFSFTFDTDNQGWTRGNFGNGFANIDVDSNGAALWDASLMALQGADHASYAYLFSPNLGGGHGALFGETLSYDFRSASAGGSDPFVVLMSGSAFLVKEMAVPSSAGLLPYEFTLDASEGWYYNSSPYYNGGSAALATNSQIQAVLNDLRHVGVTTDINSGGDNTRLDNVQAVPEPASMIALGLGALGLLKRRKA